jgi:integrase
LTPPNADGQRVRLFVQAPAGENTRAMCQTLERQAIERWVKGLEATHLTFGEFVERRFWPEYPAAKGLKDTTIEAYEYLLDDLVRPKLDGVPLRNVDAGAVARMIAKLQTEDPAAAAAARALAAAKKPARGLSAGTIAGAVEVLERMLSTAAAVGDAPSTRFAVVALRYLDRPELATSSRRQYGYHAHRHLLPYLRDEQIGRIDAARVEGLRHLLATSGRRVPIRTEHMTKDGRAKAPWEVARDRRRGASAGDAPATRFSARTIYHAVKVVKTVLSWAEEVKAIPFVPKIRSPKVSEAVRPLPYSPAEARALIAAAGDLRERVLYLLAFDTGIRAGEEIGLEWSQIDWAHHRIRIDRQRIRSRRTTRKPDGSTVRHQYKTETRSVKAGRERWVSMPASLETALQELRRTERKGMHVICDDEGRPWERHQIRPKFEASVARAGIRKIRWHDARHHFSSSRTDAGMPLLELQGELGHAEPRTTAGYFHPTATKRYASVLDADDKAESA